MLKKICFCFVIFILSLQAQKNTFKEKKIYSPDGYLKNEADIYCLGLLNDKYLLSGDIEGNLKKWDMEKRSEGEILLKHNGWINAIAVSKDGKIIATAGSDNCVKLYYINEKTDGILLPPCEESVSSAAFISDSVILLSAGKLELRNIYSNEIIKTFKPEEYITVFALSPDKNIAACGTKEGKIYIINSKDLSLIKVLKEFHLAISSVVFSKDGKMIAYGGMDKKISIREVDSWKFKNELTAHMEEISALAFSTDNKYLLSGSWDKVLLVWNIRSGKYEQGLTDHFNTISAILTFDDKMISAGFDKTMRFRKYFAK